MTIAIANIPCFGYFRNMQNEPLLSHIGALIGSPVRAQILTVLFDGRALTTTELANYVGVSASTASEHLTKLMDGGLIACEKSGRFHYYSLRNAQIAETLEMLAAQYGEFQFQSKPTQKRYQPIQKARLCYDHIAGRLGVEIAEVMQNRNLIVKNQSDFVVTSAGYAFLTKLGIDMNAIKSQKRLFARCCLDWSERRHHIAGALGAGIANLALDKKWIVRGTEPRILKITDVGKIQLNKFFDNQLNF